MKKILATCIIALCGLFACSTPRKAAQIAVLPRPVEMTTTDDGDFVLSNETPIVYPEGDVQLKKAAEFISKQLGYQLGGVALPLTTVETKNAIEIKKWDDDDVKAEGYKLDVSKEEIEIEAADYNGAVYAMQTLLQLLPENVFERNPAQHQIVKYAVPAVDIKDYPRFAWRGMHLDVSRHFSNADSVKRYIDYLAMHKFNRFHWHLTDDQGWRMESKKYPLLTEKAAWRIDRTAVDWDARKPIDRAAGEEATYGGFYTQDQIRDVVKYASDRGIVVVPEIEIPGHSSEIFAAYPALSCLGTQQEVTPGGHYPADMATCYCAGNEEVFTFLENILDETIELFPGTEYIHIGGDEVDKRFWKNCPKCKARMQAEGLTNVDELQSYFIKRIEKFMTSRGKRIIGWDEILEGGLAPNATVMSWRGIAGGIEAARAGHDVIMTPNSHLYFDYYQGNAENEPRAIGGYITTKRVYEYEPIPEALTADEAKHILGAQANLWREFIPYFDHVEYMVLPRMTALSEVVWSPKEQRDWLSFSERLPVQNRRFKAMGARFHPGTDQIDFTTSYDAQKRQFKVVMTSEIWGSEIFYTTDGSVPTTSSTKYSEPIVIDKTTDIQAIVVSEGEQLSKKPSQRTIGMHKAVGKKISYTNAPSDAYRGEEGEMTLNNGITGTTRHNDGFMQGFNTKDFEVVVDLEQSTSFTEVIGSFLQSAGTWIYLPAEMIVLTSEDGKVFTPAATVKHDVDANKRPEMRYSFVAKGQFKGRYVKVIGKNHITPVGLPGAGTSNWIFVDEIFIN